MQLIGVLIIIIGFMLKLDTIAIVILAGITTGLVSGMDVMSILDLLGSSFVHTRYMSLFLITLPVIGLLERNGLRQASTKLIEKIKNASTARILSLYTFIRMLTSILGVRLGGHIQLIRPIVYPMIESSAKVTEPNLTEKQKDTLKALSCAVDNFGNFFAQNGFIASPGVLLIVGTFDELGITVQNFEVAKSSLLIAAITLILVSFYNSIVVKNLLEKK